MEGSRRKGQGRDKDSRYAFVGRMVAIKNDAIAEDIRVERGAALAGRHYLLFLFRQLMSITGNVQKQEMSRNRKCPETGNVQKQDKVWRRVVSGCLDINRHERGRVDIVWKL